MSLLPLWPNASLPPLVHNKHCLCVWDKQAQQQHSALWHTGHVTDVMHLHRNTVQTEMTRGTHFRLYIMGRTRSSSYSGLNLHIQYCVVDFFLLNVFHIETKPNLRLTCIIHFPLTNLPLPSVHDFWECPCFKWVSDPFWATNTLYPPHITRRKSYAFEGRSV